VVSAICSGACAGSAGLLDQMLKADSNALAPVKDETSLGCTGILPV